MVQCDSPGILWGRWWTLHSVSSCLHTGGSETWLWSAQIPPQEHTLSSHTYTPGRVRNKTQIRYVAGALYSWDLKPDVWNSLVCSCTLTTCGFGSTRCNSKLTRTLWIWSLNTCSPEPNLDRFPIRTMEAHRISSLSWTIRGRKFTFSSKDCRWPKDNK